MTLFLSGVHVSRIDQHDTWDSSPVLFTGCYDLRDNLSLGLLFVISNLKELNVGVIYVKKLCCVYFSDF